MTLKNRYLIKPIIDDLKEKMVFIGGPRQVGKTVLAKKLIGDHFSMSYFNWDKFSERQKALKGMWPSETQLIVLDEFHKHSKWKTWIKGEYDTVKDKYKFILTGSARLDIFRRGGDSLQGRYHYYRLHPFSLSEIAGRLKIPEPLQKLSFSNKQYKNDHKLIFKFGGFPEPLFKQNERSLRRWHNERAERFMEEDIRDLTRVQDIGNLSLLLELLPERVSSILSINSLTEDLQVNFRTIANWLDIFERLYYSFRLPPFHSRKIASVRKEKKLYLWDWSLIEDHGDRLENMVASHLLKFCHFLTDYEGWKTDLHYLRDSTGREVDFLVTINNKPWFTVEVKLKKKQLSKHLKYFKEKLNIPFAYQIIGEDDIDFEKNDIRVISSSKFLTALI